MEATAQIHLEVPSREKSRKLYREELEISKCQWLENTYVHPGSVRFQKYPQGITSQGEIRLPSS